MSNQTCRIKRRVEHYILLFYTIYLLFKYWWRMRSWKYLPSIYSYLIYFVLYIFSLIYLFFRGGWVFSKLISFLQILSLLFLVFAFSSCFNVLCVYFSPFLTQNLSSVCPIMSLRFFLVFFLAFLTRLNHFFLCTQIDHVCSAFT